MSTNDLQKLRSCPFCGGEAHTYHNNLWHVACNDCRCKLAGFVTEAEAIAAWNTRADDAPISEKPVPSLKEPTEDTKVLTDSREKLEDDLEKLRKQWKEYDGNFMRIYSYVAYAQIKELLDRQAAITRRECERPNWDYCETCEALAELTAERDMLQAAIDAMENGQFYAMYKAKCEECEEAVSFAKRLENAVNDGQPVTLFGVDYFTAKQNKKLLAEHELLTKKLKRLRRRLAKAKKERDHLKMVAKTQAESFKKLEAELTKATSNQLQAGN